MILFQVASDYCSTAHGNTSPPILSSDNTSSNGSCSSFQQKPTNIPLLENVCGHTTCMCYEPDLSAEENPHYYHINELLFKAHMTRTQRQLGDGAT